MNYYMKLIILGFALMLYGGIMFATFTIAKTSPPTIYVVFTLGYLFSPILILIGVIKHPKK
ncbi:MAG: hypothetical protein ACFWTJ_04655 [Lachnoclostridium sp.]|jgi:xanthosine utilization system XapX-like protein